MAATQPPGPPQPAGGGDGRTLLGLLIVSRFVLDRQQLIGRRLIWQRRQWFALL
jgi:hypothetical protein